MATLTWQGGRNFDNLIALLEVRRVYLLEQCDKAISLSILDGAVALDHFLEAAVTPTGIARENSQKGGLPGRHDTGTMVNAIRTNSENLLRQGFVTYGEYGWFADLFQQYFEDQDLEFGPDHGAHAMQNSFDHAIARFQDRMMMIVRGEPVQ